MVCRTQSAPPTPDPKLPTPHLIHPTALNTAKQANRLPRTIFSRTSSPLVTATVVGCLRDKRLYGEGYDSGGSRYHKSAHIADRVGRTTVRSFLEMVSNKHKNLPDSGLSGVTFLCTHQRLYRLSPSDFFG